MKFELIEILKIDSFEADKNGEVVYDISVEDDASFCVDDNIVVHNSACTTKNATGVYYPMASLIMECKSVKTDSMPLIIADGGIKESSDCCKALALGADCVMMGSVLAAATESPSELIKRDKQFYKLYHGSASFEIQKIKNSKPKYIEGRTRLIDYEGENIDQILDRFDDGLRSSMSYFNASNLEEYRENVTYVIKL